jgi:hypothetical protein
MTEKFTSRAKPPVQLTAGILAIIPMAALAAWMYVIRDNTPSVAEFFLGPLLLGGAIIFWLLFLHLVMCRDSLPALGFRISGFWRDAATGLVLGLTFLLLKYLTDPFLRGLFESRPPSREIMTLIHSVATDPLLLALWLGPVVWIGIAGFEELWRVVVLRRFWVVFPGLAGKWIVLLLVSMLIGALHGYQGPAAIISITVKSVLMGGYFMATGRARPLIVAHAVYDSVQIVMAVIAIRSMA